MSTWIAYGPRYQMRLYEPTLIGIISADGTTYQASVGSHPFETAFSDAKSAKRACDYFVRDHHAERAHPDWELCKGGHYQRIDGATGRVLRVSGYKRRWRVSVNRAETGVWGEDSAGGCILADVKAREWLEPVLIEDSGWEDTGSNRAQYVLTLPDGRKARIRRLSAGWAAHLAREPLFKSAPRRDEAMRFVRLFLAAPVWRGGQPIVSGTTPPPLAERAHTQVARHVRDVWHVQHVQHEAPAAPPDNTAGACTADGGAHRFLLPSPRKAVVVIGVCLNCLATRDLTPPEPERKGWAASQKLPELMPK